MLKLRTESIYLKTVFTVNIIVAAPLNCCVKTNCYNTILYGILIYCSTEKIVKRLIINTLLNRKLFFNILNGWRSAEWCFYNITLKTFQWVYCVMCGH